MSGPDVFRMRPGDNAIGKFIIGVSPIGDIAPTFDVWKTMLSQYANSPILTRLVENMDAYLDQTLNFQSFYDLVMNVETAQGYGLDVWGRIVNVSRTLAVTNPDTTWLGFQEAGTPAQPFNQAPFFAGQQINDTFILTDTAYRTLIFAKALANICDGSIPAINQILLNLFPNRGNCYVIDGLDMTMTFKFDFALTQVELAIISQSGALPTSTGVSLTVAPV
jgi:hypothetical protein